MRAIENCHATLGMAQWIADWWSFRDTIPESIQQAVLRLAWSLENTPNRVSGPCIGGPSLGRMAERSLTRLLKPHTDSTAWSPLHMFCASSRFAAAALSYQFMSFVVHSVRC